jgi:3-oxoacyl-[acyl-carrier protein] reductase
MFNLYEKIALITGAERSMGKAYALALASQGATVILTDKKGGGCDPVAEEIKAAGGDAHCYAMDLTKKSQIDEVFDNVVTRFGRLDILINSAAIFRSKSALELTEEEWDETIGINLKAQFLCGQRAAKEMAKNKWGRIINISSIASGGFASGSAGAVHYMASKAGIIGMTETLAEEWVLLGITVNAIVPGAINAQMVDALRTPKKVLQEILAHIPLRRLGKPEDVAAAVVFLVSGEANYVTGATLYVDGGVAFGLHSL